MEELEPLEYNEHIADMIWERIGEAIRIQAGGESFTGEIRDVDYEKGLVTMHSGKERVLVITLDLHKVDGVLIWQDQAVD